MDGDEKNYLVTDVKEEYDHGFDQFLDEQEIDINTFVLPPQPKCSICDTPYPFEADRVTINSYCAIRNFRERSPAIFCAPQNITKHAISVILALYFLITGPGIELSCRVIS